MNTVGTAQPKGEGPLGPLDDEDLAARSAATLLITAFVDCDVEILARRIHGASVPARFPFLQVGASDLPTEPGSLRETCSSLLDAAAGGTVLIRNVDEMPPSTQDVWCEILTQLECMRPSAAVRLISGTTVSLLDRVAGGAFSERLFYRLNIIHLVSGAGL